MWVEEFLQPLLRHRDKGHSLKFSPRKGEAKIYCYDCKMVVADGDRNMIHEIFEAVLQWPKSDGWH